MNLMANKNMQKPKNIVKNFKTRNVSPFRRLDAVNNTLNHQPHFPKSVMYEDIDQSMAEWVEDGLEIAYGGEKLPTYKLFSTQRMAEYAQTWQQVDDKGNLNLNFKTITRESNPQHGENQGNNYNIPGKRDYVIFKTKTIEEKGDEVIQIYTMKQPMAVNLVYTINIVTSSYKVLNEMNIKMQDEFSALEKYIFPNGYAMPVLLNSIGDESDYTIDDRKYYSQSYQVKVLAFIIKPEDFQVKKIQSRVRQQVVTKNRHSKPNQRKKFNIEELVDNENILVTTINDSQKCPNESITFNIEKHNVPFEELYAPTSGYTEVEIEDIVGPQICWANTEDEIKVNKKSIITIPVTYCSSSCEFIIDSLLEIEEIKLDNIKNMSISIDGETINYQDSNVVFDINDNVKIEAELQNIHQDGEIIFICYDPSSIEE